MKQTLIKLSDTHYIVVDDSEIKEGDYWCNIHSNSYYIDTKAPEASGRFAMNSNAIFINPKKITHSTQPLYKNDFWAIQELKLSEVKELIGEVDVEKKAHNWFMTEKFMSSHIADMKSFIAGYNQAVEDNKENVIIFICKYLRVEKDSIIYNKIIKDWEQSLQPKTEWEVEFVDGKLKLK